MRDGQAQTAREAARDEVIMNLQQQVQQLMANALNQQAQHSKAAPRVETITVRLPDFDGRGDVDIWTKKVECILPGRNYPEERWTSMIIQSLKDTAEAYWFNLVCNLGTTKIPWAIFKQKLTEQFNYAHKQYNARFELQYLKYTTAEECINKFKRLAIKLPARKMTDEDKKFQFTVNLLGPLRVKILGEKCDKIENLCHSLREHERVTKISHYRPGNNSPIPKAFRNYGANAHPQYRRHSQFSRRSSMAPATPMDLDALDMSKARCYNCNKIRHLSKDFPSPRKIKFNTAKNSHRPPPPPRQF